MLKKINFTIALAGLMFFCALTVRAQDKTDELVKAYISNENWVIKLFAIMEVRNQKAYDIYESMLLDALKSSNQDLRTYALAGAASSNTDCMGRIKSIQLMQTVIDNFLELKKQPFATDKALELISNLTGEKKPADKKKKWLEWIEKNTGALPDHAATIRELKAKPAAAAPAPANGVASGRGFAATEVERLEDLNKNGIDLVFCCDITASMGPAVDNVQKEVRFLVNIVMSLAPSSKIGFVCFNDAAWVGLALSSDMKVIQEAVNRQLGAVGGEDWEEGVDKALEVALSDPELEWRDDTWKVLVFVSDAPPHPGDTDRTIQMAKDAANGTFVPAPPKDNKKNKAKKKVASGAEKPSKPKKFIINSIHTKTPDMAPYEQQAQSVYTSMANASGGTYSALGENPQVVKQTLLMLFGKEWENVTTEFIELFKSKAEAENPKKK
ncbi:MAG: VWA domain-containing protein [Planctomycetes bacterium]|nr:VWA domain-containing protein [Planctomycetota bacterium]